MTIDGIDASQYGIQQWTIQPGFAEIRNSSEWIPGAVSPMMLRGETGWKTIKVTVMVRGGTRQEIWEKSGNFVAQLMEPREYQFDGFDHCFFLCLKNASQAETCLKRWHKATLELEGYEYGKEVVLTSTARTIAVQNDGNLITPAVVEITTLINLVDLSVGGLVRDACTGADRQIKITRLTNGKKVAINGETGLITEDGKNKFADVDLWDLPTLKPGLNQITVDKDISMTIKYKPRFL